MIDLPNITIVLNTDFNNLKSQFSKDVLIVNTGRIDEYYNFILGKLPYRRSKFIFKVMCEDYQPNSVVNHTDDSVEYIRTTEFSKFHDIKKLTLKNAKKFSTLHPRCGTSFLLFVVFVSLLVYLLIPIGTSFWTNYLFRILLLPIIIGLSYEFLKVTAKHDKSFIMKILMQPGLLMQRISTSPPTDKQLEVALHSLKSAIKAQKNFEEKK